MTVTSPASTSAPAERTSLDPVLCVIIALVGLIEGVNGLSGLPVLFGDISKFATSSLVWIALHPLLGFAGFGFALARRLRYGIMALALVALVQCMTTALFSGGLDLSGTGFLLFMTVFKTIIQPLLAMAALAAALFNRQLAAATIAVMLPPVVDAAGVAAFAISVMRHGF